MVVMYVLSCCKLTKCNQLYHNPHHCNGVHTRLMSTILPSLLPSPPSPPPLLQSFGVDEAVVTGGVGRTRLSTRRRRQHSDSIGEASLHRQGSIQRQQSAIEETRVDFKKQVCGVCAVYVCVCGRVVAMELIYT